MRKSPHEEIKKQIKVEYIKTPAKTKELSEKYNVPDSTIRSWVKREEWKKYCGMKSKRVHDQAEKIVDTPEKIKLTEKEQLFCIYYSQRPVAGWAAKKAGYSGPNTDQVGYQLLQKPNIKAEIKRLKKIKREAILLEVDDVVERMIRIAFGDPTDYMDFGRIEVPVMGPFGPIKVQNENTGKEETLMKVVNDVRFHESSEVDGSVISEVKVGRDGASIKLHDPQKAMEWLAKYFEWNPDDRHKKAYDKKRLELAQRELELKEQDMKSKNW